MWCQNADKQKAESNIQEAVDKVSNWSNANQMLLNSTKSEVAFFSLDPGEASWTPAVTLNGRLMPVQAQLAHPVFLGITMDRTLTFIPHAEKVASKITKRCGVLASLAHRDWGWHADRFKTRFPQNGIDSHLSHGHCRGGTSTYPRMRTRSMGVEERPNAKVWRVESWNRMGGMRQQKRRRVLR